MRMALDGVEALVFDVFGTVVDWRTSIIAEGEALGTAKGIEVDWAGFVDAWRGAYSPAMDRVRRGEAPWTNLDALHRQSLDRLMPQFGITGLSETEVDHLNRVWHRLKPWPDSVEGMTRLRRKYVLSPLSNGNVALLTRMGKAAGLPWDCILSAELFRHYKPDPETYRGAAELLGLPTDKVALVAAHNSDLVAASQEGMRTAFVARPTEYGPHQSRDFKADHPFDAVATDMIHLADLLGA
jgi:2-haloacid dehalogenase